MLGWTGLQQRSQETDRRQTSTLKYDALNVLKNLHFWALDKSSLFELFLNRTRLPNIPRFFALDLEGHLSKDPPVVEQAAAINVDSMKEKDYQFLFNVNINNPQHLNNKTESQETRDFGQTLLGFGKSSYWHYNKDALSGIRVDPTQAATLIKESGITCDDYIIVWHKTRADVTALRHILSEAGFHGVMPPDDHIIRLNYLFRHNVELPKGVKCGLEFLFSTFFPTHPLRLSHHDALIDSKKAALMALLAEKLCKGEGTADLHGTG
ncbi:hypothetical protein QBC33DRAFT_577937 [Phialemonium atrogriseum]|uniref:Uncharacterized protein n=1 Tax=Phialemonium atrogriseum TaxID=1093897 RepID=A0AAJ0FMC4_9PEZI|nr:uncharacterized protein QBC33DRAFT_577937 [Phialemonium atrogriseum]KAK1767684.1 hypothetical protein QBC33DRAFT_577937 [Phialemonium atrogriseum]